MRYSNDKRTVMTLDAGGTNFVFSAIKGEKEIADPVILPAHGNDLEKSLKNLIKGFKEIESKIKQKPVAISFAFPGPAEYEQGIIDDLANLPAYRNGVAIGIMLEENFNLPVFINNDADLFAFGEALAGFLPEVNSKLEKANCPKRYKNLFGATFGTGFGGGIIYNENIFFGDNSAQAEVNRMRNKLYPHTNAEDSVSIRGIKRVYAREAGIDIEKCPEPKTIFEIGTGKIKGDKNAALKAFEEMAVVAGNTFANTITLIDGLIVIGGGLAGAHQIFLQKIVDEMNNNFITLNNEPLPRLEIKVFNLEDKNDINNFLSGETKTIKVPFSNTKIKYDPLKRIGVGISKLGTSKAVSIGAYNFALNKIDGFF